MTNAQIGIVNTSPCWRGWIPLAAIMVIIALAGSSVARAQDAPAGAVVDTSDAALVRSLPGFENGYADVNGTRLHYVAGGKGAPLFLLPGWPQTWWEFHRMMPALAAQFRVIAVDLRGMGGSGKPMTGYDKKTMAKDIFELARHLGYEKVNIAGHDIGSMVAFSFAANYPETTLKLALLDVPHPDEFFAKLTLLPGHLKDALPRKATNFRLVKIEDSGHFIPEEQPKIASRLLIEFFK